MAQKRPLLTDEQWLKIAPLLPQAAPGPKGGRPRCDNRKVLEGLLMLVGFNHVMSGWERVQAKLFRSGPLSAVT